MSFVQISTFSLLLLLANPVGLETSFAASCKGLDQLSSLVPLPQIAAPRWHSASDLEVATAICRSKNPESSSQINRYLDLRWQNFPPASKTVTVAGIQIEGESDEAMEFLRKLLKFHPGYGPQGPEVVSKVQSLYQINPECRKVRCAVDKIWGAELGAKFLYALAKYGMNASEIRNGGASRWSQENFDTALRALRDLPQALYPLDANANETGGNMRFVHAPEGATGNMDPDSDAEVNSNALITLFSGWDKETTLSKEYIVFHELAHNLWERRAHDRDFSVLNAKWLILGAWKVKRGEMVSITPKISQYARANPAEDFAETACAYRFAPERLKSRFPAKYEFMKSNFFKDMEFMSGNNCND
ncbi:MAG: hypothetical protein H7222_09005 [Methylotenera sp.]|nr:hypothetical protein [Oligoflexia bacterium]